MACGDLLSRARAGDDAAFRDLTEPYRGELRVHCYRMLGSFHDADDTVQDTLLAAWRGLEGFAERASMRTWLYRIATNQCLNVRRAARRRPVTTWENPHVDPPEPNGRGEVAWLEPFPDVALNLGVDTAPGPEARYEQAETVSLAFVTALQQLPSRQVAVLLLRDVLGFPAVEVAGMLDTTVDSVKSALRRARAGMRTRRTVAGDDAPAPAALSAAESATVSAFVRAWESADVRALVALLTDDALLSMPPLVFEYRGRDAASDFCASLFVSGRRFDLVPTRANGQPAFGAYLRAPDGVRHGAGLYVLTLRGDRISAMTRFESTVLPSFGLPRALPRRDVTG